MKKADIKVEYLTHCLASGNRDDDGADTFEKDHEGNLIWHKSWWYSAVAKSIDLTGLRNVKPGNFHFDLCVSAPVVKFHRKYGKGNFRVHEAIEPGTVVAFKAIVADHVTEHQIRELFDTMGTYIGLTPYGFNLGYGNFKLIDVKLDSSVD